MTAAEGAAPDGNAGSVDVTTILHPCDGGDAGLCEALGEGVKAHLACGAEAVPEDDYGRRCNSGRQVKPSGTGVLARSKRDVVAGEGLCGAHFFTAPLVTPTPGTLPDSSACA